MKKDFLWGTATAAVQIEGAYNEDGKSPSLWDALTEGYIANDDNCKVTCDHYHRYKEDIQLMKQIGANSYRFSIAWSRIIPNKDGKVNPKGIKFYSNLIDELLKNGIEPLVTLYHWDMPMWVYNEGGFQSEKFSEYFLQYTKAVVDAFSDRVKFWITFNEPQCFVGGGYETGWQAPYKKADQKTINEVSKGVLLAHGYAAKYIRENAKQKPFIGFAPTANVTEPLTNKESDIQKAYELTISSKRGCTSTGWWSDPIVLGEIPENMDFLTKEDIDIIHQPLDFYGFNVYTPDNAEEVYHAGIFKNALGWIVTDNFMYYAIKFLSKRFNLPILITENGFANVDAISPDGKIHDPQRIIYMQNCISQIKRAVNEGINVIGYTYWSLIDNFEWSRGFDPRFGLIYVDYKNDNKRIIKDSALYFKKLAETNGEDLEFTYNINL